MKKQNYLKEPDPTKFYSHVIGIFKWKKLLKVVSNVVSSNVGSAASFINRLTINKLQSKEHTLSSLATRTHLPEKNTHTLIKDCLEFGNEHFILFSYKHKYK